MKIAAGAAVAAHVLAWAATVLLIFAPSYSSSTGETRTLLEMNGPGVIPLLVIPVALTGIALAAILFTRRGQSNRALSARTMLLWIPAILVAGFWITTSLTIGVLYLPAALALLVAAIADSALGWKQPSAGP